MEKNMSRQAVRPDCLPWEVWPPEAYLGVCLAGDDLLHGIAADGEGLAARGIGKSAAPADGRFQDHHAAIHQGNTHALARRLHGRQIV